MKNEKLQNFMKSAHSIFHKKPVIRKPSFFSCLSSWRHIKTNNTLPHECCSIEVKTDNSRNQCYILCWVSETGKLFHYYRIIAQQKHIENTFIGHVFVIYKDDMKFNYLNDIPRSKLVVIIKLNKYSGNTKHIVCIDNNERIKYQSLYLESKAIIDNSNKLYFDTCLGGWKIKYEPHVFEKYKDEGLQSILEEDLKAASIKLPLAARLKLQSMVSIWLNDTISIGNTCCYHESAAWLKDNGLTVEKEGCIEIYSASNYLYSRQRWGIGGLMLHELSHAYHSRCITDGFDNTLVHDAYQVAMRNKLYNKVSRKLTELSQGKVGKEEEEEYEEGGGEDKNKQENRKIHGMMKGTKVVISKSPPTCEHYACTNVMEFFAELSTAYHCSDADVEFNSWWPYNRSQLKNHDPNTFQVLESLWKNPNIQNINIDVAVAIV